MSHVRLMACRGFTLVEALIALALPATAQDDGAPPRVVVGSKSFTESVILGEILTQLLESNGFPAVHKREFQGTRLVFNALKFGELVDHL